MKGEPYGHTEDPDAYLAQPFYPALFGPLDPDHVVAPGRR